MVWSWQSSQVMGRWGDHIEVRRDGEVVAELSCIVDVPLLGVAMEAFVGVLNGRSVDE